MKHAFQNLLKIIRKIFTWFLHFGKRAKSTIVNVKQEISEIQEFFVQFNVSEENYNSDKKFVSNKEENYDSKSTKTQRD